MSLPMTEQLFFTHLRTLAMSGNVTCPLYSLEHTNKLIEEGFLVKDSVVSWITATFGLAKECRDLAYEYWKSACYPIAEQQAREGKYESKNSVCLLIEGAKYFHDDGFETKLSPHGTIAGLSWKNAKTGKALQYRRLADAKYCEACNEEKIVIVRKIYERKGVFLVYKGRRAVGKREKGKTIPLSAEETLKYNQE
jgi:hypothetical protein